jgi:hypothetical protein
LPENWVQRKIFGPKEGGGDERKVEKTTKGGDS